MLRWTIDDRQVAAGHIGPPPMNYGQHARWAKHRRARYRLHVPRAALLSQLDGFFEELSASEREEIEAGYDAMDLRAIERFRAAGLPSLAEMLDERCPSGHEVLAGLVELFDLDVLEALSAAPSARAGDFYYVLASVDEILPSAEALVIAGVAYEVPI